MKIFQPIFLLFLFPLLTQAIVAEIALGAVCKKIFATTVITESISFISDIAKMIGEKLIKIKDDSKDDAISDTAGKMNLNVTVEKKTKVMVSTSMEENDSNLNVKAELLQVSEIIKQTNEKMKASFKSVKSLMRDQHFQTHIQFPVESLILHLEQFLSHPSNSTEEDLRITCEKTLPNSILKNLETMIKDNFLIHQSNLNPSIFAKLEKGIILMIKQLIFSQSVCLQIRHFDIQEGVGFNITKNIEFYIKKQRMEVLTKFHLNTAFSNTLNQENRNTVADLKNNNASLFENIGTKLCQNIKSSSNMRNIDFFLTRDISDFTVISKNRYFKESYNGWKILAFYPKFSLKRNNRIENKNVVDEDIEDEEKGKTKNVLKNQIIFECKNEGYCSLMGNDKSGMYSNNNGSEKYYHYAICGNIGVTIGRPIFEQQLRKSEELTPEEKAELEKWEKTKAELTEYLKVQKIKDLEAQEKLEKEKEDLIKQKIAKVLEEMQKAKNEDVFKASAFVSTTNGCDISSVKNFSFISFIIFCYLFL